MLRIVSLEAVAIVILVFLGIIYIALDNDSFFNFWTDRDMVRSEMLPREFQWMGAELSYGSAARVPGGFLHYLWVIPTLISKDPELSYQFCVLLGMLSLIPFHWALRRSLGPVAAAIGTIVLLASPVLFGTLTRLWNPSFQAPFIILAFAFLVRLLGEGHTASFKWMVAALVLGMQMHLSTYLLVVCIAITMILLRVRVPLREVAASIAVTLLLLLPYFIGEMSTGWDNLRQMLGSQGAGAVRRFSLTSGLLYNPDNVGDVWRWFMMSFAMNDNLPPVPLRSLQSFAVNLAIAIGGLYTVLALAHWLDWGKPITRALGITCGGGHGRILLGAAIPVLVGFLYFSYSPQVELVIYGSARYLMFAMPGLAIVAGLGVGALFDMAGRSLAARIVMLIPIAVAFAAPAWALTDSLRALDKPWDRPGREFMGGLTQIGREAGWGLADTVARTTILRRHDASADRWRFESIFGIGYELHRTGTPVPFAAKGNCAAFLTAGHRIYGDKGMSPEALARSFAQPNLDLAIVRQKRLSNDLLVIYQRNGGNGYCFTSVTNRYVFSNEEKAMFEVYGKIPEATAKPAPASFGKAHIANLGQGIYAMLRFGPADGKLALEIHSNQLRGDTYNGGFLDIGMIEGLRVRLQRTGADPIEILVEKGLVGGKGTFTPIRILRDVPTGTYDVILEADVFPPVKLGAWPVDMSNRKKVSIPVASGLSLPN